MLQITEPETLHRQPSNATSLSNFHPSDGTIETRVRFARFTWLRLLNNKQQSYKGEFSITP